MSLSRSASVTFLLSSDAPWCVLTSRLSLLTKICDFAVVTHEFKELVGSDCESDGASDDHAEEDGTVEVVVKGEEEDHSESHREECEYELQMAFAIV